MRWGRGFFRLWLALSVIWIAVTGYTARDDLWLLTQWDVLKDRSEGGSSHPTKETASTDNQALLNQRIAEASQVLRETAFGALGVVLLPPLSTLLAGLLLSWIGRGFLQMPEHEK
jgi:hypothetical protein